ncbi:hypothetical protein IscW_ISCW004744 [Ixodes scapularis]|uniref:Uncharacterized protein n=1 Tax=Ixodes scapularis TaxID=6945 RepID=B7PIU5_IXOSC|nr:hypothetical protein IscW_ISCW004744 [Ixodes scapularis]|eukprot:XP_002406304.1 hypothetical protein IscW_ISCW004744 [Ixodes scapularis]
MGRTSKQAARFKGGRLSSPCSRPLVGIERPGVASKAHRPAPARGRVFFSGARSTHALPARRCKPHGLTTAVHAPRGDPTPEQGPAGNSVTLAGWTRLTAAPPTPTLFPALTRYHCPLRGTPLEKTFSDSEFEESVAYYMQSWLPNVPAPTEEHFKTMTKEEAYRTSFGYVQYYAVGLEQAVLDQIFHNGPFHRLFLEIQNNLGQLLCELQLGIVHFNVAKNPDVLRDVMSHEYRDIKQDSQRNLRDYIILREYIKLTKYISQLFSYLRDQS